jgi:hypothetical protein
MARHEAVLDAWDDAWNSYNKMRADERAKGDSFKVGDG